VPAILAQVNAAVCFPVDPTAVVLESFTATPTEDGIQVAWATSSEVDTWGFHLLRSSDATLKNAVRVTPELIAAEGRGQSSTSYSWLDTTTTDDADYTYWLEETEVDGSTIVYEMPVQVAQTDTAADHTVYLPLVRK
jgi:hypothetical protein